MVRQLSPEAIDDGILQALVGKSLTAEEASSRRFVDAAGRRSRAAQ
jgi:hypothetical protein